MESYQNIQQNFSTDFVCSITSWPVTSGSSRGEDPLKNFFASPGKMCLDIVQMIGSLSNSSPLLLSQAGYGPICMPDSLSWKITLCNELQITLEKIILYRGAFF